MNLKQANEIRAQIGLPPLVADTGSRERRVRQERNRRERAAQNRELTASRQRKGK